ncbi:FAD-dependent monooxygenase [Sphingobium sp. DC-2]|uniref:FAD-dependent monooxygenase n=1 Tax=Sphingobium sp. DC-2 TaxID=1303256 RepID=UPI0005696746|nr:FAD-dependent monooxygenase [Sphingobium sp. DC-2]
MVGEVIRKVLIVGGGIGGMALAILLRSKGLDVDLAERDPQWRATGAGLTLNGATLRVFSEIGIEEDVRRLGSVHGGVRLHDRWGTIIEDRPAYVPEPGDIMAGGAIMRPVLHQILAERTRALGTNVRLGLTVNTLDQDKDGVTVTFSDGSVGRYDLVVGADGLHSQMRKLIFPDAPGAAFVHMGAWRAVFPRPAEMETTWLFLDASQKLGFNPVSKTHMYLFILEPMTENQWREPEDWPRLLSELMSGYCDQVSSLAKSFDESTSINYRPLEMVMLPQPWHSGRVVLLGDACHGTTPHSGYGAGLATEDAVILAEQICASGDLDERLNAYCDRRYPRCHRVMELSLDLNRMERAGVPIVDQFHTNMALMDIARQPY